MPTLDAEQYRAILHRELPALAARYGVASLGLFGSFVRRENGPDSDLDVLVSFVDPPGLFGFVELENHLSDLLSVKVDLVMRDALKPHLGQRVLAEVVPV
jgi:predicted nucleotidyltransferase